LFLEFDTRRSFGAFAYVHNPCAPAIVELRSISQWNLLPCDSRKSRHRRVDAQARLLLGDRNGSARVLGRRRNVERGHRRVDVGRPAIAICQGSRQQATHQRTPFRRREPRRFRRRRRIRRASGERDRRDNGDDRRSKTRKRSKGATLQGHERSIEPRAAMPRSPLSARGASLVSSSADSRHC